MTRFTDLLRKLVRLSCTLLMLFGEVWRFLLLCLHPSAALAAENLFLLITAERSFASNWRCIRNATFNRNEPPIPPESP
jgi:hypothetical protein